MTLTGSQVLSWSLLFLASIIHASAIVITVSDVPGVLAVARVSAVADVLTAVDARLLLVIQTLLGL